MKLRGYNLRKKKSLPYLFFNDKKYSLRNTGYYGNTKGKRQLIHIEVWEYYNGEIPKGFDIHHIDRDKSNNKLKNLEMIEHAEHSRKFATGRNQYTKHKI